MDPSIQRQIKHGVAGSANILASCDQQSGNCVSAYCRHISHLSESYEYLELNLEMNTWN